MIRQAESLLFQRFNYFLVVNAFLTTAFATLAVISFHNSQVYLWLLTLLVAAAGLITSYLFSAINLSNAQNLRMLYEYAMKLEQGKTESLLPPYTNIGEKILSPNAKGDVRSNSIMLPSILALAMIFRYFHIQFADNQANSKTTDVLTRTPAPTTWIIPWGFSTFFWLPIFLLCIFQISIVVFALIFLVIYIIIG